MSLIITPQYIHASVLNTLINALNGFMQNARQRDEVSATRGPAATSESATRRRRTATRTRPRRVDAEDDESSADDESDEPPSKRLSSLTKHRSALRTQLSVCQFNVQVS